MCIRDSGKRDLVEETAAEHPFQFISGLGTTLEAFESQIVNLHKGDKFEFTIPFAEAYGEYDEEHVIDLPKNIFEIDGKFDNEHIYPGNIIPLMNSEGQRLNGSVVEVDVYKRQALEGTCHPWGAIFPFIAN